MTRKPAGQKLEESRAELRALLREAKTRADLLKISEARGYGIKWVDVRARFLPGGDMAHLRMPATA